MDDVRLYSGALSNAEVQYLYGFVGYWKFAEGTGTTAADSSGVANTATLFRRSYLGDQLCRQ